MFEHETLLALREKENSVMNAWTETLNEELREDLMFRIAQMAPNVKRKQIYQVFAQENLRGKLKINANFVIVAKLSFL